MAWCPDDRADPGHHAGGRRRSRRRRPRRRAATARGTGVPGSSSRSMRSRTRSRPRSTCRRARSPAPALADPREPRAQLGGETRGGGARSPRTPRRAGDARRAASRDPAGWTDGRRHGGGMLCRGRRLPQGSARADQPPGVARPASTARPLASAMTSTSRTRPPPTPTRTVCTKSPRAPRTAGGLSATRPLSSRTRT